jgi:protein O-GlcNAc transferase
MVSDGTDAKQAIASTREAEALPAGAYVFCNFANASRITRDTFALWMRILQNVPAGVLWLKASHPLVVKNLAREAQRAGVEPDRLIFARRAADKPSHLGRLVLADLAVDTLEWHNGHTTTSDMLWAGVPVLTSPGRTFASRVATSLVRAAGLPEAIASNAERYVACAVELSANSGAGHALRSRLSAESTAPFFDSPRLVRGLEQVYEGMFAAKMRRSEGL